MDLQGDILDSLQSPKWLERPRKMRHGTALLSLTWAPMASFRAAIINNSL
jgi:hypothetical protein